MALDERGRVQMTVEVEVGADAISLDGLVGGTGCSPMAVTKGAGIPTVACIPPAVQALKDMGVHRKVKLFMQQFPV